MWVEIGRREYDLHAQGMLPKWDNQFTINQYRLRADRGEGWVVLKRRRDEGFVIETVMWRARG